MARKVVELVEYIDDLDGSVVAEDQIETISFSYKGTDYKIDLKASNAKKIDADFNKWIKSAEKLSKRGGRAVATRTKSGSGRSSEQLAAIREWAINEGYEVAPRGRIKAEIVEAFDEAH